MDWEHCFGPLVDKRIQALADRLADIDDPTYQAGLEKLLATIKETAKISMRFMRPMLVLKNMDRNIENLDSLRTWSLPTPELKPSDH